MARFKALSRVVLAGAPDWDAPDDLIAPLLRAWCLAVGCDAATPPLRRFPSAPFRPRWLAGMSPLWLVAKDGSAVDERPTLCDVLEALVASRDGAARAAYADALDAARRVIDP